MKNLFALFGFMLFISISTAQAQTLIFSENFETTSLPDSIAYTGTGTYGKSSALFSEGLRSDSMKIAVAGDSVVMTTQAFSTTGSANVMLYFDHICKIEFFDEGYVEVSNNNGTTWTRLTGTHYLGTSQFAIQGNKFTAAAYTTDWAAGTFAVPSNAWWKNEVFDISSLTGNAASVRVRFVLRDAQPGNTMPDNYAWFIDHIRVIGAISELIPPVITLNPPIIQDTVYSAGPFVISATITDSSGVDTAMVIYTVNAGTPDTIGMVNTSGNLFTGSIPVQPFNSNICYKIVAIDGSVSQNTGYVPSLGCTSFYTKQAMMGTYTIGGTGANYASFSAAVTALTTSGVSGPVEFVVAPGTYTEQITLTSVVGMDPVNTVTFRSANNDSTSVTLQYTATGTTNNWTVRLSGASYFIFRKLTIRALSTSYGRVVEMINGSMYNLFANNRLITAGTSTSTTGCIYDYNTLNHYNTYLNNYMEGGYYTIYIYGVNTTSWQKGTVIQGNTIVGSYYYPMYIYYTDSTQVIGNYIHSGTGAYSYGINCYYINNQYRIVGNRVAITATSSSACYGIRDYYGNYASYNASPTGYGLVANNMVSITGGTGTHYGLYAYYCNGTEYYYNSISITGGSTSSRVLYQANTASNTLGQKFANNIFSITSGGFSAYFGTPAQVVSSDYNDLYSNSTTTFAYWNGNIASFAALQTASGKEANSVSILPPFTSTHDLTLTSTTLSGKGIYVPAVTNDFFGRPRPQSPTIGAYEMPLIPKDAGVSAFVTPTSQSVIGEASSVPVTVTIKNHGTDTITTVDVYYMVNNGTPVMATYTGQLVQFQTANIVFSPFISPAGNVTVAAWTALQGDTNTFNDTAWVTYYGIPLFDAKMKRIIPYADPCGLNLETVRVVIVNNGSATIPANFPVSYKLDSTTTVVTHTVPDSIPVNDSLVYSFPTPVNLTAAVDTTFKLFAWVALTGDYVQTNDTTSLDIESKTVPPPPTVTTPVNIPYGAQATLNATSTLPVIWYATDTSTVKLDTGYTFVTPYLFDTTTFWVQAGTALGAPASLYTGTQSSNYAAAQTRGFHFTAPVDMIITELMVPNTVTAGTQYIQVVKFSGYPVVYPGGSPFTTLANITNAPFNVPQPVNIVIQAGDEIGIIGACNSSGTTMNNSYGAAQVPSSIGGMPVVLTRLVYQSPLVSGPAASGTIGLEVAANIARIDVKYVIGGTGCPSVRIPVVVNTALPPPVDAGVDAVLNPAVNTTSGTPTPITVSLKNFGMDTLFSANIVWSLNNVIQDTFPWTGILTYNQTAAVTIDTASFAGGIYCIKSWTSLPNGVTDSVNTNDTVVSCFNACMAGTYTIGPAATGTYDFNSFNSAVSTLVASGICGPIVFDVYPGTYTEQVTIPQISGMNINNTVTFRGTGDSTQAILEFSASSTSNWTLRLDGADYFRFEKLTIKALNATTGRVVELINGALNNKFSNNQLITAGTSSSTTACIYDYNTLNHYNVYQNNYMKGGYYGMYIYGVGTSSWEKGTIIKGNTIRGTYYYPIYVYYGDSVEVIGNLVDSVTGTYSYGINVYYTNNYYRIVGNTVKITGTSGVSYGIRDYYCNYYSYNANPTGFGLVANNMVSISGSTSGHYGMYAYYNNGTEYYYNSVSVTGGSSSYYGLYQGNTASNTLGQKFKNNTFSNTAGGYAAYFGAPSSVTACDYNNYFSSSSNLAYWGTACTTLAALKTTSGTNANSQNLTPPFKAVHDLHLANTLLSAKGTPIASITTDIDGEPRGSLPTIGADEVPLIPKDAGVTAIITPGTLTNEGQTYPVEITVTNFGTDTLFAMDVQYTVNNGTPVVVQFSDTLLTGASKNITMPSMVSPAGNSTICAKTLLLGDTNFFNDQLCKNFFGTPLNDAQVFKLTGLETGCGIGLDTISIWVRNLGVNPINSPSPSTVTASYRIKPTAAVVTETFTPVVLPGDSVLFHFTTLANFAVTTVDDTFNVISWVDLQGDNVKYNDTATATFISMHSPAPPVVTNVSIPYATSTTLFAQSPDSIKWYASDTASVELASGAYYTTPILYTNTTYWAGASSGSYSSSGPYNPGPNIAPQAVASASTCNTGACSTLNDLNLGTCGTQSMWISTSTPPSATPHVEYMDFTWPADVTIDGMKIHHAQNNARFLTGATMYKWVAGAWVSFHTFSNLPMQCENTFQFPRVTTTKLRLTSFQMTGTGQLSNPNFREIEIYEAKALGCSSTRSPLVVTITNPQACDVGITQIIEPINAVNLGSVETVKVRVFNFGTAAQSNIPVSFQVDNLPAVTETITASIPTSSYLDYTFVAKANLSVSGATYQIKAWTGLSCDITHLNDTMNKSVTNLLPTYCTSTATSALYQEIINVTLGTLNNTSPATGAMYTNHTLTALPPMLSPGVTYPMSITSGFAPSSSTQQNCYLKAWIDLNRDGAFDAVTEEVFAQATTSSNTVTANIQIPFTAVNGNTMMRVVLQQTTSASAVVPCGTYTYGETEDYMVTIAPQAACDAGVVQIISPTSLTQSGVALPVWVKFMNFGSSPIAAGTLSIAYKLNNGTPVVVAYPSGMAVAAVDSIQMPSVTLGMGNNTLCVYTILACDSAAFNNEICMGVYGQYVSNLPYFDDFENANNWYKPVASTNWQYGTPSASIINAAYSGSKAWVTNLTGDYTNNANEYLYTPVFNFGGLGVTDTASVSFWHWCAMAASDYGRVQVSTDGGVNWSNLGFMGDPMGTNWYNTQSGGTHYFSLTNSGWMSSSYKLDPNTYNGQQVQFRFHFWSNTSGTSNGWAIDNFNLALPVVPNDVGVSMINYPVNDTAVGSQVYVVATIKNYGSNTQTMIPLQLKVNGVVVSTETWTGALSNGATTVYPFVLPFTVPSTQYNLCVSTMLPGDPFAMNDENCKSFNPMPAYHDVGAVLIVAPLPDSVGEICLYDINIAPWYQYTVKVRLQNFGQNAQTSIPLKYTFYNGGPLQTETWTGNLAPGTTVDVDLTNKFLPNMGAQQMCVETNLLGDLVVTNNKTCQSYIGVICFGVDELDGTGLKVGQNIPNPATGKTLIPFVIPESGEVQIVITDLPGQVMHREVLHRPAGEHTMELDVSQLSQGVFYYTLEYKGQRITRKMVVRK